MDGKYTGTVTAAFEISSYEDRLVRDVQGDMVVLKPGDNVAIYFTMEIPKEQLKRIFMSGSHHEIKIHISHLPPPVHYGDTPLTINAYEDSADFNIPPTAPIIMVLNLYAHLHAWNFTWKDLSTYTDKFILEKMPKAVTGLDFILL